VAAAGKTPNTLLRQSAALLEPPPLPTAPLSVPHRLLHGPGPTSVHPRVLAATSLPVIGHMHAETTALLNDISAWLRYAFQTKNAYTLAVSGSGHAVRFRVPRRHRLTLADSCRR
jgi:alanine-glyoxylate transaminase/serine-glyoxylate transaminase/serine-pyruvate transaminase